MAAIRLATQWPATARLQGLAEPCRRDTKWLATATVMKQWLPPPVASTLPCGWATGVTQSLTRVFT